jgi:aldose 1-epimerase
VYVSLKYVSPDGEDGYPGSLATTCQYRLSKSRNKLSLNITAESTAPTPVNITNHSYFNLKGHTNGDVLDHVVQIHGKRYVETDKDVIATGKLLDVKGTAMDFTAGKAVGKDIGFFTGEMAFLKGYDHCFLIDKKSAKQQPDGTRHCATVSADGRTMKVPYPSTTRLQTCVCSNSN